MVNDSSLKTALITGGTDGIGKAIASSLVSQGIHVVIVGRNREKGLKAERELGQIGGRPAQFMQADLSLMRDVDRFAEEFGRRLPKLDFLVLNAGVVLGKRTLTPEDIETSFATNYLGRFVLSQRLLPLLKLAGKSGAASRILVINGAAKGGKIHYDDINLTRNFGIFTAVPQFCEANDVFVIEQARRLVQAGDLPVTINALKIGAVKTKIRETFPTWMKIVVPLIIDPLLGQTPEQIAESAAPLITSPQYEGHNGELFIHIKGFKFSNPGKRAASPEEGRKLWELSERLIASCASCH